MIQITRRPSRNPVGRRLTVQPVSVPYLWVPHVAATQDLDSLTNLTFTNPFDVPAIFRLVRTFTFNYSMGSDIVTPALMNSNVVVTVNGAWADHWNQNWATVQKATDYKNAHMMTVDAVVPPGASIVVGMRLMSRAPVPFSQAGWDCSPFIATFTAQYQ